VSDVFIDRGCIPAGATRRYRPACSSIDGAKKCRRVIGRTARNDKPANDSVERWQHANFTARVRSIASWRRDVSLLGSRYAQAELSRLRRRRGTRKVAARREDFAISMIAVVSCRAAFTRRSRQLHARNNGEAGALATYASILQLLDGLIPAG